MLIQLGSRNTQGLWLILGIGREFRQRSRQVRGQSQGFHQRIFEKLECNCVYRNFGETLRNATHLPSSIPHLPCIILSSHLSTSICHFYRPPGPRRNCLFVYTHSTCSQFIIHHHYTYTDTLLLYVPIQFSASQYHSKWKRDLSSPKNEKKEPTTIYQ